MLRITLPATESWDERTEKFVYSQGVVLELEHSLVSLSKWEAQFEKPFLKNEKKSIDETLGYIQAMCLTEVDLATLDKLSQENILEINAYIESKQTATWFRELPDAPKKHSGETITSELIYYWMSALQIPIEFQHWHLNRLFVAIKVANEKNQPKKKMSKSQQMAEQRRLNAERLQQLGTRG